MSPVLVVTRFVVPEAESSAFLPRAQAALAAFAARPGYLRGRIGRAADDPSSWVITTEWAGVGAYRRSLSSYDVKVDAAPLLSLGVDEPSAYELLHRDDASAPPVVAVSRRAADADRIGVGEASAPAVPELP
ncbi:MAG: antibiotic biosynthesis monooxygenase family protein [Frankiales bacterium]|nr:antibiotic biosynthesis monooxygenase family protein [Frankiales bacterium]